MTEGGAMPLRDHFHPPLAPLFHWESFHSAWASGLTNDLNGSVLPDQYSAAPYVHLAAEDFEVKVTCREGDRSRLAGAVELISPTNKDRPDKRKGLAARCAGYLHQGASVSLVDIVTTGSGSVHTSCGSSAARWRHPPPSASFMRLPIAPVPTRGRCGWKYGRTLLGWGRTYARCPYGWLLSTRFP